MYVWRSETFLMHHLYSKTTSIRRRLGPVPFLETTSIENTTSNSSCILYAGCCFTCRIDYKFVIEVADFGLSESIDTSKQYFRQDQLIVRLPIKWLAPESINEGVFSEKSDVVS
jgi:hypothetical protein